MTVFWPIIVAMTPAASTGSGFSLRSPAFLPDGPIAPVHTCDDADTSPPLQWTGEPKGTRSFALIVHDPDAPAGDWLHWAAWNIPRTMHSLPAGVAKDESLPDGTRQGINDFGTPGYGGPCPPSGTHHYVFVLYALDAALTLPANASRAQIEKAIEGHLLAKTELVGAYQRHKR